MITKKDILQYLEIESKIKNYLVDLLIEKTLEEEESYSEDNAKYINERRNSDYIFFVNQEERILELNSINYHGEEVELEISFDDLEE